MAHHAHSTHPTIIFDGGKITPEPQWYFAACPGALIRHIDRWLWLNVLVSLSALTAIFATRQWADNSGKAKQGPATSFALAPVILAGLFYTTLLLILCRRERRITEQANTILTPECIEDARDESCRATERGSIVFMMLVVGQNGLAALLLYMGIRTMLLVKTSPGEFWRSSMYVELGYAMSQVVLMTFVIIHCTMHDDKLEEYLRVHKGLDPIAKGRVGYVSPNLEEK